MCIDKSLLLCLRGKRTALEVERISENDVTPGQPQNNSQSAHDAEYNEIPLDLCPALAFDHPNKSDQDEKGQE